ncbi:hydrolase [Cellulomonas hominis]|uniref:Beta-galactosidase/beta-glucuronidase n=1 Tax=Cellulomonas hominis TaxID=156981 RepID=A0A511FD14_9CELL|nr:glycoside hydrolase family 2 TIM barrel-domain containing protein [Cellulomonas hominis]MBB5472059.1 beta-galactosidase/beta-glucuronidase [Cellulomonas hominis]GEL46207.1 hydrolase [Cellulomonas hominis]
MTSALPHDGFPRPDRDRSDRWVPLDGTWELDLPEGTVPVVVPFAWETAASGVARTWLEHATYRRTLVAPPEWAGSRVALCFGAVHHRARVRVDGVPVAEHVGGTTPFEVDVTDALAPGVPAVLEVEVDAPADKRSIPHGKQRSIPRDDYDGVSFTPTSGIWQSVWLEARGRTYAAAVAVRGDSLTGFDVTVRVAGDAPPGAAVRVAVAGSDESVELVADGAGVAAGRLDLRAPRLWSPADPHLYRLVVRTADDTVTVTGGLRRIETRGEHLHLNGERLYLRGVLDQGYWPSSGLTAPSTEALLADLALARDLGYTLVRKHLKLEDPRWLHAADRMGMLVWAEPPAPSRFSPEAAAAFEAQLAPMVERDGNHPSVVVWGLYNEEWGLDWDIPGSASRAAAAASAYDAMRALDDTRPVVENSGWSHVRTDLVDWHYYDEDPAAWAANVAALADGTREDFPVKLGPDFVVDKSFYGAASFPRRGVPVLNSEYGAGFTSLERAWHLRWQTQELRRHDRFAGYVYTELTDVEHEMAGLRDADRRPKDLGGLDPRDANADTVLVLDLVPRHAGADVPVPDGPLALDVHVSHHGPAPVLGRVRAAWVAAGTPPRVGEVAVLGAPQAESEPLKADPFALSPAVRLDVPPPGPVPSARLLLWLVDEDDRVRARTFVDAAPQEPPNRRGARR